MKNLKNVLVLKEELRQKKFNELLKLLTNNDNELMELINVLKSNDEEIVQYIEEFYCNDEEFFDTYFNNNPMEAVRSSFYGNYKFMDKYVYFNGYGNLESFNYISEIISEDGIKDIINYLLNGIEELVKDYDCLDITCTIDDILQEYFDFLEENFLEDEEE